MEKQYRFTLANGERIICGMIQFAEKYCTSKCIGFRNAIKRVPRDKYNNMNAYEQRIYESKRERAVPEYRIYGEKSSFYTVTKKDYEVIRLPVKEMEIPSFPTLVKYSPIEICMEYENKEFSEKIDSAMEKAERNVRKQVVELMKATGYIHTGNFFDELKLETKINYTDICATATTKDFTLMFHYSGTRTANGMDNLCLLYVDLNGVRIMNNPYSTYSFDGYMKQMGICKGVGTAEYLC